MIQPSHLSQWIFEKEDLWQLDLLNPSRLNTFIKDRKVDFWEDQIVQLWRLGWVRAEIVKGVVDPAIEGIEILEKREGETLYADIRDLGTVQVRVEEPVRELIEEVPGIVPYFHPFEYFAFWHIKQIMQLRIHPYQMMNPNRYHEMLDRDIEFFYQWAKSENAKALINRWDEITQLAIATEPCTYPQIIGSIRFPPQITVEDQRANIEEYQTQLKDHYLQIGIEPIKEIIRELCISAEMIEPNKSIHSLLRFMNGGQRIKVKGNLGGAILLKLMAEIIRRMAESSFGVQLPEEDEMGFGMWVEGAREKIYGSKRIFDNGLLAKRQFIRQMGLDAEVRIRIYIEGPTEYAAFSYILRPWPQIEVFDLSGQFIQGKRKGLAFRENLILDDRSGVFSVIILDGDREDNIRIVKKAAEEDLFCGQFYISQPDFEFYNFSKNELVEIIWDLVDEVQKTEQHYLSLCEVIKIANNADNLIKAVRKAVPPLSQFAKGSEWGEKLAEFAARKPGLENSEALRPLIDGCQTAIRSIDIDYLYNRKNYRVDPNKGKLVRR